MKPVGLWRQPSVTIGGKMAKNHNAARKALIAWCRAQGIKLSKCPSNENLARKAERQLNLQPPALHEPYNSARGRIYRCLVEIRSIESNVPEKAPPKRPALQGFYQTAQWQRLRYDALYASSGRCELCGRSAKDGVILNVDHIKPIRCHPDLALDPANLQVLCGACNAGKGNRDDTDWR